MSDEHKKRRLYFFILTALLAALIAYSTALEVAETENIFEIFVNNTNLAPSFPGEIAGTGERTTGIVYWANNSPIQLFVWAHATTSGDNSEIHLLINGTKVSDTSGRPLGAAETSNKTITAIIPKFANYSVEFNNYHHYEWREYPILSGRNGTLSINQSVTTTNITYNNTTNIYSNVSSGSYIGDGTTNRFIPYSLGRTANKININSNITPIEMGMIIEPSYIYSTKSGNAVNVTPHNSTGFFVSGIYNTIGSNVTVEIGDASSSDIFHTGFIYYSRFTATGNGTIIDASVNFVDANKTYQVAIYSNNSSNLPNLLLNESGNLTSVSGWGNATLSINNTVNGTSYWFAIQAQEIRIRDKADAASKYQVYTYGAFPTNASSVLSGTNTPNVRIIIRSAIETKYYWVAI